MRRCTRSISCWSIRPAWIYSSELALGEIHQCLAHSRPIDLPEHFVSNEIGKVGSDLPSSALICSTGGASSSEYSGSDSISALTTSALLSTRSLPSQPLLSGGVMQLVDGGGLAESSMFTFLVSSVIFTGAEALKSVS